MNLFSTGVSYNDLRLQADAGTLNLGWVRFPAGTADDDYDWTTGQTPTSFLSQFSSYTGGSDPYDTMVTDQMIVGGKTGGVSLSDFSNFISTQRTGTASTTGSSPTHMIGVINTFTDSAASAGSLASTAQNSYGIPVDLWELGNEPVYFPSFYADAYSYLGSVQSYSSAIKGVVPAAKVAVWIDSSTDAWTKDTATYSPRFWDQLYTHSYPNATTSLTNAGFTNPTTDQQIAFYNGFLLNNTNTLVDSQYTPLFGNAMQIEWSEFNINTLSAGLYDAVYLAEFTMRLSSDSHVTHAGMHALVAPMGGTQRAIGLSNDYITACETAYTNGQPIDTSNYSYNFGYFFTPQGLALQVIDTVINTSSGMWPTNVNNSATIPYYNSSGVAGTMPAIYAQAYAYSGSTHHVLLTNKSAETQRLRFCRTEIL